MGFCGQLQQVPIAHSVPGQQNKVVGLLISRSAIVPVCRRYIELTADNWLYPSLFGLKIERDRPVQRTMIGDSQAVHAQLLSSGNQSGNTAQPVKEAIFRMNMEMGEH